MKRLLIGLSMLFFTSVLPAVVPETAPETAPETVAADEAAIRNLLNDSYTCLLEKNPDKLLSMLHPEYVLIQNNEKSSLDDVKRIVDDMKKMYDIIERASAPDASLKTVIEAVFEICPGIIDEDSAGVIDGLENTEQGRELRDKAKETLKSFDRIYRETLEKEMESLKIESVAVTGDKAKLIHTVKDADGKNVRGESWLIKVNGKWLFIRQVIAE